MVKAPDSRFVHVGIRLNLCTRPDNLTATNCTTVQENHLARRASYGASCPDSALQGSGFPDATWAGAGSRTGNAWDPDKREAGKGKEPGGELLAFPLYNGLVQGRVVMGLP